jgi:hypothetical protein
MLNYHPFFLLLILWKKSERERHANLHSRYHRDYYHSLTLEQQRLRDKQITQTALNIPHFSSWVTLFNSCNDQALIGLTGLNFETFEVVLPIYYSYSPWIGRDNTIQPVKSVAGRKRLIDATTCLGLYLAWTRTRGSCMILQMVFGLTGTPLCTWLRFAR